MGSKNFWAKIEFGSKKILNKKFWPEKDFWSEKDSWSEKKFTKVLGPKYFWFENFLGLKKTLEKSFGPKINLCSNNMFGPKQIFDWKKLGEKIFWSKNNFEP